jgi:hypothetical protein
MRGWEIIASSLEHSDKQFEGDIFCALSRNKICGSFLLLKKVSAGMLTWICPRAEEYYLLGYVAV